MKRDNGFHGSCSQVRLYVDLQKSKAEKSNKAFKGNMGSDRHEAKNGIPKNQDFSCKAGAGWP